MQRSSALALVVVTLVAGCTSAGPALHPYDSGGVECIPYPDLGYRVFPYDPSLATNGRWPLCTLSCQQVVATAGAAQAPLDQALPAGPCDDEGATCDSPLMAGWTPPCKTSGGPGNAYTCTCRGHAWHCALTSQGGNVGDPSRCLMDGACYASRTATQVCACGSCWPLCTTDADCATGRCHQDELCFSTTDSTTCPGPDECLAKCTGFCR